MDEILETAKIIGTILCEIVLGFYFCKQYIDNINKKTPIGIAVREQNGIDLDIIKHMDYYKELLGADRVLLFEFHNGQHYSNYRSALKMSASYEVYRAGLESARAKCTNIPLSIMPDFVAEITSKGKSACGNLEDIKETMINSYAFKKSIGIQSFYDLAIRDERNEVIGFVAVQWNNPIDLKQLDIKSIEKLTWFLEESVKKLTNLEKDRKKKWWNFLFWKRG